MRKNTCKCSMLKCIITNTCSSLNRKVSETSLDFQRIMCALSMAAPNHSIKSKFVKSAFAFTVRFKLKPIMPIISCTQTNFSFTKGTQSTFF